MKIRCSGWRAARSNSPTLWSVPETWNTPATYSMSAADASSADEARSRAVVRPFSEATRMAEPPVKSEREPALPKPVAAVGVALHDADLARWARRTRRRRAARSWWRCPAPSPASPSRSRSSPSAAHRDGDLLLQRIAAGPFEEGGDAAPAQLAALARASSRGRRSRASRPASAPGPARIRTGRCHRSGPSRCCRASAPAGSCCAGGARPGRCRACARRRPSGAR